MYRSSVFSLIFFLSITSYCTSQPEVTIGLMGDVMLGRLVGENIQKTSYSYPWGDFIPLLKKNDLNIINLESAFTTCTKKVPKTFNFKSNPANVVTLQEGYVTVANLANNHIRDYGDNGLKTTIEMLDKSGILHVGAGDTLEKARKPVIITKNGIKIGIIGCTDNEPRWLASKDKPGTNYVKVGDTAAIVPLIKKVKKQVNILILSMHWGPNMRVKPTKEFIDFAHALIDAGIDIFQGHSAHIIQAIEVYKGKLILYDTGDFIDDYAVDKSVRNDLACLFNVTVDKEGVQKIDLVPGLISNMQVNKASPDVSQEILTRIRKLSRQFGTHVSDQGSLTVAKKQKKAQESLF